MVKKCEPKSTWQIYLNGVKSITRIPSFITHVLNGLMWLTIGISLCVFQSINTLEIGRPLFIISFPLNVIIGGFAIFVIIPLAMIHMFNWMEWGDC